jgi:hypothetical protein
MKSKKAKVLVITKVGKEMDTSRLLVATARTTEIAIHSVEENLLLFEENNFKTSSWVRDYENERWRILR